MRVTLGTEQAKKQKQLCSYYGHLFLKALRVYCIECQKGHDLRGHLGPNFTALSCDFKGHIHLCIVLKWN